MTGEVCRDAIACDHPSFSTRIEESLHVKWKAGEKHEYDVFPEEGMSIDVSHTSQTYTREFLRLNSSWLTS